MRCLFHKCRSSVNRRGQLSEALPFNLVTGLKRNEPSAAPASFLGIPRCVNIPNRWPAPGCRGVCARGFSRPCASVSSCPPGQHARGCGLQGSSCGANPGALARAARLLQHPWCPRCLPVLAEGTTLLSGLPRARRTGAHRPDVAAREGAAVIAWQSFLIPLQES